MKSTQINERLIDDLKAVLQQAEELLEATSGSSGSGLDKAREKLGASVELLRNQWGELSDRAVDAARTSRRIVREHPYETAGGGLALVAAAVGLVWLWQRLR